MALLEILTYPDPRLKQVSNPVEKVDREIEKLVADMLETMYAAPGIGLAAPQVGIHKRVIVLDVGRLTEEGRQPLALVNPEIVSSEGETVFDEGCLSVPEFTAEVTRAEKIVVSGLNERGEAVELDADGLLAIALQHEVDHLEGILFFDRLGKVRRDIFKRKYAKMLKNNAS